MWQSPLFRILIPLTTGEVAGLWAQGSGFSHLLFCKGLLLGIAVALVICHILLQYHPRNGILHLFFSVLIFTGLGVFGYMLCYRDVPVWQWDGFSSIHNQLKQALQRCGVAPQEEQLLSALLLGDKTHMDPGVKDAFRNSGISHVLALSGLHVGMIAVLVRYIVPPFVPFRKIWHLLLLWSYIGIVGFPVSAVRAALMLTIWWVNPYSKQHTFNLDVVMLAFLILVSYNPRNLTDVGFQLSFCAVTSILFFQPSWRYNDNYSRTPQQWFWVCISAQIGVLPLTLYYFGTFPTYFLIANLLITPVLLPLILYIGVALLMMALIFPQGCFVLATPLHYLFEVQFWIVEKVNELPFSVLTF